MRSLTDTSAGLIDDRSLEAGVSAVGGGPP
jgi:hypothetical protein